MKTTTLALTAIALLTGCAHREIPVPWSDKLYRSDRLGVKENIGRVVIGGNKDGTYNIELHAYESDFVQGMRVAAEVMSRAIIAAATGGVGAAAGAAPQMVPFDQLPRFDGTADEFLNRPTE